MPAYNAAKTLCKTDQEVMSQGIVDPTILLLTVFNSYIISNCA